MSIEDTIIWLESRLNSEDVLWKKGHREISEKLLEHLKEYQNAKRTLEEIEKEKKLRPYKNISEFCNETGCEEVGVDVITIRNKSSKQEYVLLYVGYSDDTVHLGGYLITLKALFENYEFLYEDEWLPFGVEE